jgi:hypothetical protein
MMIATKNVKSVIQFILRLPPDVHERLKRVAKQENRSLNAQIVHILQRWLDAND